jgi:hypothetical protein
MSTDAKRNTGDLPPALREKVEAANRHAAALRDLSASLARANECPSGTSRAQANEYVLGLASKLVEAHRALVHARSDAFVECDRYLEFPEWDAVEHARMIVAAASRS